MEGVESLGLGSSPYLQSYLNYHSFSSTDPENKALFYVKIF
jgi:hypothetical protein